MVGGPYLVSNPRASVSASTSLKTVKFFGVADALKELKDPENFDKIDVVKELLNPANELNFNINDYIDLKDKLRLVDIAFIQGSPELLRYLIDNGAHVNKCTLSAQESWLYKEMQPVLFLLNNSKEERIQYAEEHYSEQLEVSIKSFVRTSQQAKLDTGMASVPGITKLMVAYAERLALLPEKEQINLIQKECDVWKKSFRKWDRSFVIALGNGILKTGWKDQLSTEYACQYAHRQKLRATYENIIRGIFDELKPNLQNELREWVQSYFLI